MASRLEAAFKPQAQSVDVIGVFVVQQVHSCLYRGKLDRPKSERSQRTVALSSTTRALIQRWRQQTSGDPEAWVFPSARTTTPLGRDNAWRRLIAPKFKTIGLDWATFQVMRRTHASLCRQAGIDPKLVADQLGHGLGVNLDVYTVVGLDQRQQAVQTLEATIVRPEQRQLSEATVSPERRVFATTQQN